MWSHPGLCPIGAFAALALWAAGVGAAEPTWREANKESARIIRERGPPAEAAELAQRAFDLYVAQSETYSAKVHAQLLLNAVDARRKVSKARAALVMLDRGIETIVAKAGSREPVLLDLLGEGVRLADAGGHHELTDNYYERAVQLAEAFWGKEDARAVLMHVNWAMDMRQHRGYQRTGGKLRDAREHAIGGGESSPVITRIDFNLAKLEIERERPDEAIPLYESLARRLEPSPDPADRTMLQTVYAQLELAHEMKGDRAAAAEVKQRLTRTFGPPDSTLRPLARVPARYPRSAAERRVEGWVELTITVAPDGGVREAKVQQSRPPGVFDEAALEAVRGWKFAPRIVDGKAVEYEGQQRIVFKMQPG